MEKVSNRHIWLAVVCFAMFVVTTYFLLEAMDVFSGEYDEEMLPGRYVVLVVADSGVGMTPETVDKIFDPFFTTKPVGKGTGLGLSMVQGFVKQSSGSITVQSESGKGTSFKLVFPAAVNMTTDHVRSEVDVPGVLSEGLSNGRILLVEDQKEVMHVLQQMLTTAGFDVVTAASGDAAFSVLRQDDQFEPLVEVRDVGRLIVDNGIGAELMHSGLPQNQREKILEGFRAGKFPLLIATYVAARGLDESRVERNTGKS